MADPATYRPKPGSIPTEPGVYRFIDVRGTVIYVGKAKNLRSRLNSYFADPANLFFRTKTMVHTAARVEWTIVQNELEALQLEYTWIKKYDPRFNVVFRDDKTYPWLAVTWGEDFPRVFVGRGAKRKGTRYFGPFSSAWAIRETLGLLLRVFPMRSCTDGTFRQAKAAQRPCLLGYIDKCAAPCVGRLDEAQHREIVAAFMSFMSGQSGKVTKKLEQEMAEAAAAMEYERAAKLRDSLKALAQAQERQAIVLPDGTDADIIALAADPLEVAIQVFHVRAGRVAGERAWVADRADDADIAQLIEHFCLTLYADASPEAIPPEIIVEAEPPATHELEQLLSEKRTKAVRIKVAKRGVKRTLVDTVSKNAHETLAKHKVKRASDLTTRNIALDEIKDALGLAEAPLRIECFDISHTQGVEVVASMVVFEDGLARKSEYRRFIIRSFEGSNDVAAMHEVISRRVRRLLDDRDDDTADRRQSFAYQPSLIVVDGGAPQVEAARKALVEAGLEGEIALCGLAKRLEEVWLPGEEFPMILPRESEGLYLLQRLRDEAHRFAITHHKSRRSKVMVESVLDGVKGLGRVRRKALIDAFKSLKKLRAASVTDIAKVPGFGPTSAQAVVDALREHDPGEALNTRTGEITDIMGA